MKPRSDASTHTARIDAALSADAPARSAVAASWARSARLHHLDPESPSPHERLSGPEMRAAAEAVGDVLAISQAHLDLLFSAVSDLGACVVLADAHGVAIDRRSHPRNDDDFKASGLRTGTCWSEASVGTNGIGTALFEKRPVTIARDQHFLARNIGLTCTSAPIFDPDGSLVAVLDVSMTAPDANAALATLLGRMVTDTSRRIDAELLQQRYPRARMVIAPGGDRLVGAVLAVDGDDMVIGATRAARARLALPDDLAATPVPLVDLLGVDGVASIEEAERAVLRRALARSGGNISQASRALGISRSTFHRKLDRQ